MHVGNEDVELPDQCGPTSCTSQYRDLPGELG